MPRTMTKYAGVVATMAPLAFLYWLLPEYNRSFYDPFYYAVFNFGPWIALALAAYIPFVDAHMKRPHDGLWLAGALATGERKWASLDGPEKHELQHHALGWVIKGFYMPMMFVYLGNTASGLASWNWLAAFESVGKFTAFFSKATLAIDLAFVTVGYGMTFRLVDSHIRTANPYAWGWVVTLALYQPFWSKLSERYFRYSDGQKWEDWIQDDTMLFVWGLALVGTRVGWAWANTSFGLRFSNLTNRGIITHGAYRLTRHPSYLFKNTSWWLINMPFLSQVGHWTAFKNSLLLLGVNGLYFLRAKAEEAHLAEDPKYVQYAEWMDQHGPLRFLQFIPFVKFRRSAIALSNPDDGGETSPADPPAPPPSPPD